MTYRLNHRSWVLPLMAAALGLVSAGATSSPASAQGPLRFGVGYVANTPDLLGGVGGHVVFPAFGGLGVFADVKFDWESPSRESEFRDNMTAAEVLQVEGVRPVRSSDSWRSYNIGLVRPVLPSLKLYAGAGYAVRTRYRFFFDPDEELGEFGFIWVESPGEEKTTVNALFGGFMRVSRVVSFQIGIETAPRGLTVGVMLGSW
jgi:hypothetical protein